MGESGNSDAKSQTVYVLCLGLIGSAKSRDKAAAEVEGIARNTTRFRVADVAGKVALRFDHKELLLFFLSDPSAPLECAVELGHELNRYPEIRLRMGICSGQVTWDSQLDYRSTLTRDAIDSARRLTELGDSGHILLVKRLAYEIASNPRWDKDLYELDDFKTKNGRISIVSFYSDRIGNPEIPTKIRRQRGEVARSVTFKSLKRSISTAAVIIGLAALTAGSYVLVRRTLHVATIVTGNSEKSLLVLPFTDLSPARDQEYLSDGIAEEILDQLANTKHARVIGRASAFAFKNRNIDPKEIARRLSAQTFVQGSVRRDGMWIRLAAQIINAQDGSPIWSKTFEADVRDVPLIEKEVTGWAARALDLNPLPAATAAGWAEPLTNDLYLHGLFLSHKTSDEDLESSLDFFRLALDKNPKLSRAWSGTAKDLIQLAQRGRLRPKDAYWRAQEAAKSALMVDRRDAEAHVYLGETKRVLSWDLAADEAELNRAFAINPDSIPAHLSAAVLKQWLGLPNDSWSHIQAAFRLDPVSPLAGHFEVMFDLANDRLNEAVQAAQRLAQSDPSYTYFERDLALAYRERGKLDQALDIYLRLAANRPQPGLAIVYARLNRIDDSQKILDDLVRRADQEFFSADEIAAVYATLGDKDEAFQWLNRAIQEHSVTIHNVGCGRDFRSLRSDSRYPALLRRIGLDPNRFLPR
jgi:TolB-like protein